MFLYPLNALIEDQLSRIRRACDSVNARAWLDGERGGNRFWFGRYTGATPVSGARENTSKRGELRRRLREMQNEWSQARVSAANSGDDEVLSFFQDPSGSEMWSRWDMQEHPPDILITNYSMLNIMLMRSLETGIFQQTREWLAEDRETNRFHLVVDELHTYRGTPGTEVGYLLRTLIERLGLWPDSPQLRVIATSASMEAKDPRSVEYLQEFFGKSGSSFRIIEGTPGRFPTAPRTPEATRLAAFARRLDGMGLDRATDELATVLGVEARGKTAEQRVAEVMKATGLMERVRAIGEGRAVHGCGIWGRSCSEETPRGLRRHKESFGAWLRLAKNGAAEGKQRPFRYAFTTFSTMQEDYGHALIRSAPVEARTSPKGTSGPPVGRLYTEPRPRCDSCGSRVLELLYCQPCGEVFVGGYRTQDEESHGAWFLSPDFPDLKRAPDRSASLHRRYEEYLVFWPAGKRELARRTRKRPPAWGWDQDGESGLPVASGQSGAEFGPARTWLWRLLGRPDEIAGYVFTAPVGEADAFPSKCPHCAADWARRVGVKSPIRDLGSGFQRIMQILGDTLVREMAPGSGRKLVLFSDSRLDAAKLSTGIKLAHYRDTLRQAAFGAVQEAGAAASQQYREAKQVHSLATELAGLLVKQEELPL